MNSEPTPPVGACVYHRRTAQHCIVIAVHRAGPSDEDGMCVIDAVQGQVRTAACDPFDELTPALADLMDSIVMGESERLR